VETRCTDPAIDTHDLAPVISATDMYALALVIDSAIDTHDLAPVISATDTYALALIIWHTPHQGKAQSPQKTSPIGKGWLSLLRWIPPPKLSKVG
jgi:hypothetical protein